MIFSQVHNEKKQVKYKEIENIQFKEKKSTMKLNVAIKVCVERDKETRPIKNRLSSLHWRKGEGCPQGKTPCNKASNLVSNRKQKLLLM